MQHGHRWLCSGGACHARSPTAFGYVPEGAFTLQRPRSLDRSDLLKMPPLRSAGATMNTHLSMPSRLNMQASDGPDGWQPPDARPVRAASTRSPSPAASWYEYTPPPSPGPPQPPRPPAMALPPAMTPPYSQSVYPFIPHQSVEPLGTPHTPPACQTPGSVQSTGRSTASRQSRHAVSASPERYRMELRRSLRSLDRTPDDDHEPVVGEIKSPAFRGRGLTRDKPPIDSFRRTSRPRRPVLEAARCSGSKSPSPLSRIMDNSTTSTTVGSTSPARKPFVPPLALNKVFLNQEGKTNPKPPGESRTAHKDAASSTPDQLDFGGLFPAAAKPVTRSTGSVFDDKIKSCEQPIHKYYHIPAAANAVYVAWVEKALAMGWIEQVASAADTHILLKPRLSKRADGTWHVTHDFTLANAMATAEAPAIHVPTAVDVHNWATRWEFLVRCNIPGASYAIPVSSSQRRFYGFTVEAVSGATAFYRYARMPPGARGASKFLLQTLQQIAADGLSEEMQSQLLLRGEEFYVGAADREGRDNTLTVFVRLLSSFGFNAMMPTPRTLSNPKTGCAGLIHDRSTRSLRLPDQRVAQIPALISALHTPTWAAAATQLLSLLQNVVDILPANVTEQMQLLRQAAECPTSALLDSVIYLTWDALSRDISTWTKPLQTRLT